MIYQKIFKDDQPYRIGIGGFSNFPEHRHADLEFSFCLEGEYDIIIDKKTYRVKEGGMSFVPAMVSHAVPIQAEGQRRVMTLIVGSALLKKHFSSFSRAYLASAVYDLNSEGGEEIRSAVRECAEALEIGGAVGELAVLGCVYKLCARILHNLANGNSANKDSSELTRVENVEKALELIYYSYTEQITVEDAAALTGYSKSNFCKVFKTVVGESFHKALNRQRAESAACLLRMSNESITEISAEVGFSEPKAFCRVFKDIYGVTPGQYRRSSD